MIKFGYTKSVVIFGMVLPIIPLVVLAGIALYKTAEIESTYEAKQTEQMKAQLINQQTQVLMRRLAKDQDKLARWEAMLANETRRSYLQRWKKVEKQFKAREFIQELPVWKNTSLGLGSQVRQSSSQVEMSFDATFRAMQTALIEMETNLPQMQLDSMQMTPSKNGGTMNFKTTYTLWTKN